MTIPAAPYPDAVTLEAVCTVATGAYASGQFMGLIGSGVGQASNPLTFSLPWPPGTEFLIQSVQLIDLSKQSAAIDVVFFNAFPGSTTFTDSATFAPAAVDLSKIITVANITSYDSVFIATHISVGGIILFGLYQTYDLSSSSYTVYSVDVLGLPATPTSAVTNGGAVASFATTASSSLITVTLNNHGYTVGSSYPILVSTTVGGVTLYGNYTVTSVTTNTFTILAQNSATSSTSASINGGNAKYIYYYGYGPLSTGSGYGIGGYSPVSPA